MKKFNKILSYVFLIGVIVSLFGIVNILAQDDKLKVTKAVISDKSVDVTTDVLSYTDNKIENSVVFHRLDDYVIYDITIKNTDSKDYFIKSITDDNNSPFISYEYNEYKDQKIAANSEITIKIKAKYSKLQSNIENRLLNYDVKFKLNYTDEDPNPYTFDNIYLFFVIGLISLIGLVVTLAINHKLKKIMPVIVGLLLIPITVFALNFNFTFTLKNNYQLKDKLKLTYDNNGTDYIDIDDYGKTIIFPFVPEKTGYTFEGWYTDPDNGEKIDGSTIVEDDMNLYPHYVANELIFDDQTIDDTYSTLKITTPITPATNGTGDYTYSISSAKDSLDNDVNYFEVQGENIVVKEGAPAGTYTVVVKAYDNDSLKEKEATYTFNIGKQTVNPITNLAVDPNGDVTWTNSDNATGYEISFDGTNWQPATSGDNFLDELTNTADNKTVYVKAINADTDNYEFDNSIASIDVTIYTLTFSLNNDTYATLDHTSYNVISGVTYEANSNVMNLGDGRSVTATLTEKTGYTTTFINWSDPANVVNADKELIAYFNQTANPYTIVFNKNATDATGSMSDQDMTYDLPANLNLNEYTRTGYTFAGWAESTDGSVVYTDGEEVVNLATTGSKILYAKWNANPLSFPDKPFFLTYSTSAQNLNVDPAANGTGSYTYTKTSGDANITVAANGSITIPAGLTAGTHTIVITASDDNSGSTKDATYTFNIDKQEVDAPSNLVVAPDGDATWNPSDNATGYEISLDCTNYASATSGDNFLAELTADNSDKTVCLKAVNDDTTNYEESDPISTTVEIKTITFNANNATYGTVNPTALNVIKGVSYSVNTTTFNLIDGRTVTASVTEKTGYTTTFNTWSTQHGNVNDDLTVIANFNQTANPYTIVFNKNATDATGSMSNQDMTYDIPANLNANSYTRTGYTFAGWATSTAGSVVYTDGAEVNNLATSGQFNLYAKWDANELVFNDKTINKTYSTTVQTDAVDPATNGTGTYTYTKALGDAGITVATDGTITINASLTAGTHTIVITATDSNSGATKDATYTIEVAKQQVNNATNLAVNPVGDITWTNSDNATGYEISFDGINYVPATSGDNFLNELTADGNDKIVYLKTINSDTENYENPTDPITLNVDIHHVTINVNDDTYGSVDVSDMYVIEGLTYTVNSNVLTTQDNRTVTATAGTQTGFEITFVNWSSAAGTFNDDTTITANFDRSANNLVFADQSFNKTYSTSTQTANVVPATNGTGVYTYTKKSGDDNISVTPDGTIVLNAGINTGTHTVVITVNDNLSLATKDATYTFNIAKQKVNVPTNLNVATNGDITWTDSSNATGYEISLDCVNYTSATNGDNFLTELTATDEDKTVCLKAVNSDTTNYDESDIVNKNVEIISIAFDYNHNNGTLSLDSLNAIKGVTYYTNSNKYYLSDGRTVTATAKSKDGYTTTFTSWSAHSGTLNDDGFFGAYFTRTANQYSIVFNKNATDATGAMSNQDMTYDQAANLNANSYTREGYTFAGWAESTDGEVIYLDGAEVNNLVTTGSKILYAKWTANDLVFNDKLINKTYSTSAQTDSVDFAINGTGDYSYTKASGDADITVASDGTITINASLNAGTHTIVITATDDNSGATKDATYTIEIAPQQVNAPTNLTIASNGTITWDESDNATGYEISFDGTTYTNTTNGSKYLTELTNTSDEKTVYVRAINSDTTNYITPSADLSKNVTIISLNTSSNDIEMGNIDNSSLNVIKGATYTTSSNKINLSDGRKVTATAETGYHFVSWSSTSGTINATTNITATFAPNTDTDYTVNHYVHDLGTNTYTLDSTDNLNGTTGDSLTVANLSKSITGFTYVDGYVTGDTTKPDSGAVTTTTILPDGSRVINLYYRRNYLYIQYDMNGGNLIPAPSGKYGVDGTLVTCTDNDPATYFVRGLYGSYVSKVNLEEYTVNNAGLHNVRSSEYMNLEKTGYKARKNYEWNTKADGTGEAFDQAVYTYEANDFAGVDLSTGDQVVTLYVDWVPVDYTITYDLDGGSQVNPKTSYTVETATFTLVNPTKEGYTFAGWTGSNGEDPQVNVAIETGSTGNKTYTANWTPNTYTIKYNVNTNDDVDGTIADQEMTYGVADNLTASPYNRIYYNFDKWNTEPDGSGTPYTDGQSVSNLATSGVVNLYAQWEDKIVCKRASQLHSTVLNSANATKYGFSLDPNWFDPKSSDYGSYTHTFKNTMTVVYGLYGTDDATYTSGDAFTCDVNGDGIFDEETERFYYVNDYFNPNTQSFDNNYATLMYYNGWYTFYNEPSSSAVYAYNDDPTQKAIGVEHGYERTRVSPLGPISAVNGLPTNEQWTNIKLVNKQRQILSYDNYNYSKSTYWLDEDSETYMYPVFDYGNHTARLITSQEFINSACNAGDYRRLEYGVYSQEIADNCLFIYENTDFETGNYSKVRKVYTENPQRRGIYYATWFDVDDYGLELFHSDTVSTYQQIKPTIEIPKKNFDLTIKSYLISFVAIPGVSENQFKSITVGDEIGELPTPGEKEGYNFDGWYTEPNGAGIKINSSTKPSSSTEYYAYYTPKDYTVIFNSNADDADGTMSNEIMTYDTSKDLTSNSFNRVYYEFAGWNTKPDGSGITYTDGQSVTSITSNDEIILYAQWQNKIVCQRASQLHSQFVSTSAYGYDFGYNLNGYLAPNIPSYIRNSNTTTVYYGSYGSSNYYMYSGDAFTCDVNGDGLFDENTERFYYVSDYYDTSTNSFDNTYATLVYYSPTVTAYSVANQTCIPDNFDGSSGAVNGCNSNGPTAAINTLPTRTQWTNVKLKNNQRQIVTETGKTYIIHTADHTYSLPVFDYDNKAARLLTYQEVANGCNYGNTYGSLYNCSFLLERTKFASTSDKEFQWLETPLDHGVYYVAEINSSELNTNLFGNYHTASATNVATVKPTIDVPKASINLYIRSNLITFDTGITGVENQYKTISYGDYIGTLPTDPVKPGYTFDGWYTEPNGAGTKIDENTVPYDNVTYYANYTGKYPITLDNANADTPGTTTIYGVYNEGVYLDENETLLMNSTTNPITLPTKVGYTFAGYYYNGYKYIDSNGYYVQTSYTNLTSNMVFTAEWTSNQYSIVFDANGGTGEMDSITAYYGYPTTLTTSTYTKSGLEFVGWNTKPDGSGDYYRDGQGVINLVPIGSVILYAQYATEKPDEYKAAILADGMTVRTRMSILVGDQYVGNTNRITSIIVSPTEPPSGIKNNSDYLVSDAASDYDIYMWFDDNTGTLYFWTEHDSINLNYNSIALFAGLTNLTELDLSYFNTDEAIVVESLFYDDSYLTTIYTKNNDFKNIYSSNYMFMNCYSLVGGSGTLYDANHTNKEYAHVDGGTSNPGYFTLKS